MLDFDFWRGRRVLLTGHTGFKGSWLLLWLQHLGAQLWTYALEPETQPNLFNYLVHSSLSGAVWKHQIGDLADRTALHNLVQRPTPSRTTPGRAAIGAQRLRDPIGTWARTSYSMHLLEALKSLNQVVLWLWLLQIRSMRIRSGHTAVGA